MKICNLCKTVLSDDATICPKCDSKNLTKIKTKKCAFCDTEVAAGTIVCPHCHRILPPEKELEKVLPFIDEETEKPVKEEGAFDAWEELFGDNKEELKEEKIEKEPIIERAEEKEIIQKKETLVEEKMETDDKEEKEEQPKNQTIIYNIYTTGEIKEGATPVVTTVLKSEDNYTLRVAETSQTFNGAPNIVNVDEKVVKEKDKEESKEEFFQKKERVKKPPKEKIPKKSLLFLLLSVGFSIVSLIIAVTLPIFSLWGEKIYGLPLAMVAIPISFSTSIPCGYVDFGAKYVADGIIKIIYNYIPYIFVAVLLVVLISIIIQLFALNYSKHIKEGIMVSLIINIVLLVGIGVFFYTFIVFDSVDFGLIGMVTANIISAVLIMVGYQIPQKKF